MKKVATDQTELPYIVQVAINVPLTKTFSYQSAHPLPLGSRVLVPFRNKLVVGIVWDDWVPEKSDQPIKSIATIFDEQPRLPTSLIALIKFCARYYHYPIGQALFLALPAPLRKPQAVLMPDKTAWGFTQLGQQQCPPKPNKKAQHQLWMRLSQLTGLHLKEAKQITLQAKKIFRIWEANGWIKKKQFSPILTISDGPTLNAAQQQAINEIQFDHYHCYLLYGITGSGKTEVYLALIGKVLQKNRQILVLVPEISLTPQLIKQFIKRFPGTKIVALHSKLSDKTRFNAWHEASVGHAQIVIGARLSIFTPLPNLGLIVIDEEHDQSFKQQDNMRYHARDLGVWRAHQMKIPIVLCSATPSLETIAKTDAGRWTQLTLNNRANHQSSLPTIQLVDIRHTALQEGLSQTAIDAIQNTLALKQQSLLFINRRGFAPVLRCTACGWIPFCLHCTTKLVVHHRTNLQCHLCGYTQLASASCPSCGNCDLQPLGQGTQRIELALSQLFPQANILRVDKDTMQHKDQWENFYESTQQRKVDILVGTQILTKGHDFPHIATVVVLNADSGLYSSDFRAAERLFSQLIQVSGRAGRADTPGQVFIQTAWPDHPLYKAVIQYDVKGFAKAEIETRQAAGFPPATYQALLRADCQNLAKAIDFLVQAKKLANTSIHVQLYGPIKAITAKIKDRERAQLVVESAQRPELHNLLNDWLPQVTNLQKHFKTVRWSLDVDPQEF